MTLILDFQDRSIKKYVAQHLSYLIVIETDYLHPGKLQVNIYEDTVSSLGGKLLKRIDNIHGLSEAKTRADNAVKKILDNLLKEWQK